jgi:hypothetical protein
MAKKLSTTADKLEINTNKVTGTSASAGGSWTDAQYPSAKLLYNTYSDLKVKLDMKWPIGSVMCMSSNANPASTFPGTTWELIDKDFKHTWFDLTSSCWTASSAKFGSCVAAFYGHTIMIRLSVVPTKALSDSTATLGKFNLSSIGLSSLYFGKAQGVAQSDGGSCTMCYTFGVDGTISSIDVLNLNGKHEFTSSGSDMASNTYPIYFTEYFTVTPANMPDSCCNKFYFKRTA